MRNPPRYEVALCVIDRTTGRSINSYPLAQTDDADKAEMLLDNAFDFGIDSLTSNPEYLITDDEDEHIEEESR